MYSLKFTTNAQKDSKLLKQSGLKEKTQKLLNEIIIAPFCPSAKKLSGSLAGIYSRRVNIKRRIVYEIREKIKVIKILRMWSHYE